MTAKAEGKEDERIPTKKVMPLEAEEKSSSELVKINHQWCLKKSGKKPSAMTQTLV